jgi:hypothetical protein
VATKTKPKPEAPPPAPAYEIRKNATNRWELREGFDRWHAQDTSREGVPPLLGVFDTTEAAAHFALQHAQGAFEWRPFDPQGELDAKRAQLEGNLHA